VFPSRLETAGNDAGVLNINVDYELAWFQDKVEEFATRVQEARLSRSSHILVALVTTSGWAGCLSTWNTKHDIL
jgi:hypothetical protein